MFTILYASSNIQAEPHVLRNSSQQAKRALTDIYKAKNETEVIINRQNYNIYILATLLTSVLYHLHCYAKTKLRGHNMQ